MTDPRWLGVYIGVLMAGMLSVGYLVGRAKGELDGALRLHWHLITRHVHPEWHGHCDGSQRGCKPCDRPHWHFMFRHRHTETGR